MNDDSELHTAQFIGDANNLPLENGNVPLQLKDVESPAPLSEEKRVYQPIFAPAIVQIGQRDTLITPFTQDGKPGLLAFEPTHILHDKAQMAAYRVVGDGKHLNLEDRGKTTFMVEPDGATVSSETTLSAQNLVQERPSSEARDVGDVHWHLIDGSDGFSLSFGNSTVNIGVNANGMSSLHRTHDSGIRTLEPGHIYVLGRGDGSTTKGHHTQFVHHIDVSGNTDKTMSRKHAEVVPLGNGNYLVRELPDNTNPGLKLSSYETPVKPVQFRAPAIAERAVASKEGSPKLITLKEIISGPSKEIPFNTPQTLETHYASAALACDSGDMTDMQDMLAIAELETHSGDTVIRGVNVDAVGGQLGGEGIAAVIGKKLNSFFGGSDILDSFNNLKKLVERTNPSADAAFVGYEVRKDVRRNGLEFTHTSAGDVHFVIYNPDGSVYAHHEDDNTARDGKIALKEMNKVRHTLKHPSSRTSRTLHIPRGCRLVIGSDGVFDNMRQAKSFLSDGMQIHDGEVTVEDYYVSIHRELWKHIVGRSPMDAIKRVGDVTMQRMRKSRTFDRFRLSKKDHRNLTIIDAL